VAIRIYSGGDDSGSDGDDAVAVCEVQVWADRLIRSPSPRAGHAAAGFRGHLFVFGGYDSSGFLLNDMFMYNMMRRRWRPVNSYGHLPAGRSSSQMTAINSGRLAISGGVAGTTPFKAVWINSYAACPPIAAADLAYIASSRCTQGGSACLYTCQPYAVSNNGLPTDATGSKGWLVCGPAGAWMGRNPPCSAQPPVAPTVQAPTLLSPTSARITWTPLGATTKWYEVYTHDNTGAGMVYDVFENGPAAIANVPPQLTDNYWWWDPGANATTGIVGSGFWRVDPSSHLRITAAPGSSCFGQVLGFGSSCPFLALQTWPTKPDGLTPNPDLKSFAVETKLKIEGGSGSLYQPGVLSGLGMVDWTTGLVQFMLGLEYVAPYYYVVWQSFKGASPGRWRVAQALYGLQNVGFGINLHLKIERSLATGDGYEAFYRLNAADLWMPLQRPAHAGVADFYGAPASWGFPAFTFAESNLLPALIVSNAQSTAPRAAGQDSFFTAGFDYFKLSAPRCALAALRCGMSLTTRR
jgi:hypothetical protein